MSNDSQAQPRWTQRPEGSNWGDFGPDDQRGRMNLITDERRLAAFREVREGKLFDRDWLGVTPGVDIHVVWVHVPDEIAHERILARNQPGDTYKLAHWDEYRQRRFVPDSPTSRRLLMFDNHAPSRDAEAGLVATILRKP